MDIVYLLNKRPYGYIGAVILLLVIIMAAFAPVIAPYDPDMSDILHRNQLPGGGHILGTDLLGRDNYSRLLYGARPYLEVGLITIGLATMLGLLFGILGSYINRKGSAILSMTLRIISILTITFLLVVFFNLLPLRNLTFAYTFGQTLDTDKILVILAVLFSLFFTFAGYQKVVDLVVEERVTGQLVGNEFANVKTFGSSMLKQFLPLMLVILMVAVGVAVIAIAPSGAGIG